MRHSGFLTVLVVATSLSGCQHIHFVDDNDDVENPDEAIFVSQKSDANASILQDQPYPELGYDLGIARAQLEDGVSRVREDSRENDNDEQDLWERMRQGFDMDFDKDNDRIQAQVDRYANNQRYFDRTSQRASRYLKHIIDELEARGMPKELALLPMVESAFDPFAYSHGRASGMWQFIPSTGRALGMEQNWWYDGRRDVVVSTDGALNYLESLANRFDGDYELALAAYNAGGGRVAGAIRRGGTSDYWSLNLPTETQQYVPRLLALARIIEDPEAHGVELPELPDQPYFAEVDIGGQLDLAQAADMADVDIQEIYLLNPAYNRWATAPDGPHRLLIPYEAVERFESALEDLPDSERMAWRDYTVQSGDSLIRIARQFETTVDAIREHNDISGNSIREGQSLLIPVAGRDSEHYQLSESARHASNQARQGRNRPSTHYQVQPGDTFWDIASAHNVDVQELARWNSMAPGDPLHPGKELVIYSESGSTQQEREGMVRRIGYQVRPGDSLSTIASRYNVGVNDIAEWNDISTNQHLQPGQSLTLYVDIRNSP